MIDISLDALLLLLLDSAAVSEWEQWLGAAKKFFGATSAALVPLAPLPGQWMKGLTVGMTPDREDAYRQHYHLVDTWTQRIRAATPGTAYNMEMLVPDRELSNSEIYNDFMKPAGRRYALGVTVEATNSRFLLAFSRQRGDKDFEAGQMKALERVSGFLRGTLVMNGLRNSLEAQLGASREVINQYPYGVILLDAGLKVVFFNKVAGDFLSSEEVVGVRAGQIVAMNPADERKLKETLQAAASTHAEQNILMLTGPKTRERIAASVTGVSRETGPLLDLATDKPAVMIVLTSRTRTNDIPAGHLESLMGFTRQEARTASLLVAGNDVNEIAADLSISRETVRYYLKSLFWKTGTHSQRELVGYIGSSFPPVAPGAASVPVGRSKANGVQ